MTCHIASACTAVWNWLRGALLVCFADLLLKAVMTVVTLCDGNVTNRHAVTANLSNMTVPLKTVTDMTALLHFVTVWGHR